MVKGPNKILMTLDDLTFINPQQSRKLTDDGRTSVVGRSVTDLKGTARPSRGSVSGKSVAPAPESSSVAVYEVRVGVGDDRESETRAEIGRTLEGWRGMGESGPRGERDMGG
uniref:Retinal guanylyl cyclase 2-like n=1 Tax=Petromyzon marinus TaxID=7757 RepID=A0AAJ7U3A9_PETMA|nr:retinal guanylyl cyclase 2-like [Petromyzon marinus]